MAAARLLPAPTLRQLEDLEFFSKTLQLSPSEVQERVQIVRRVATSVAKSLQLSPTDVACVGSFACGLATAESDIDLAIVKPSKRTWVPTSFKHSNFRVLFFTKTKFKSILL